MGKVLTGTRYLIIVPIIGLILAAGVFFVIGGFSLIRLIGEAVLASFRLIEPDQHADLPIQVEIVEYVHTFLIGTVLFITAVGFYQL
ncbi:MAG: YqhA family protein, partial [Caldilineaceae bacterium]|nr:YqhA family protein [Caldilineaceae bacterium]